MSGWIQAAMQQNTNTQENTECCSFLDLSGLFRFPDGRVQDHLFYDGVHINMMASRWLAEWIRKFIARVPRKKYWGR